jgi:transcription elongation GreA/GreB family factor
MKVSAAKLRACLVELVADRLALAQRAAEEAKAAATDAESTAETKWDTFGLENSYLAHGQAARVEQAKDDLQYVKSLILVSGDEVRSGALVGLELGTGVVSWFLLAERLGGLQFQFDGKDITLVTLQSPIGKQLIGKRLDDEVRLMRKSVEHHASITEIAHFID